MAPVDVSAGRSMRFAAARSVGRAVRLVWETSHGALIASMLLALANAALIPLSLWLTRRLVNDAVGAGGHPPEVPLTEIAGLGVVIAFGAALTTMSNDNGAALAERVAAVARQRFAAHGSRLDLAQLEDSATHDRMQRASEELHWRPYWLVRCLFWFVSSGANFLAMVGTVAFFNPGLAALAFASVLPITLVQRRANHDRHRLWKEWTSRERESGYVRSLLISRDAVRETKANGMRRALLRRHERLVTGRAHSVASIHYQAMRGAAVAAVPAAICLAGAYFLATHGRGAIDPGLLAATIAAVAAASRSAEVGTSQLVELESHAAFLGDLFSFLDMRPALSVRKDPIAVPTDLSTGVRFEGVHFIYPNSDAPALSGIDLVLRPGEMVALVGENGAGKSTIVNLLLRFYDPDAGRIAVGGVDIRDLDLDELRSRFGVLFQDFIQYQFTARENVAFGRPDDEVDTDALDRALRGARARGVVDRLPNGLDTNVGWMFERAVQLSGGQWQRLALARLMYRDAPIWILDEPTAALDAEAEAAIFARLRSQLAGRIGLVVSHRFSTVRIADRIVVLEHGRILEQGSHEELVARGGRYADLFELQAAGYR